MSRNAEFDRIIDELRDIAGFDIDGMRGTLHGALNEAANIGKAESTDYAGQTLTLLREWFSTEIDSEDEEYGPWIASFTARVVAALAKNPVNAEPSASTQSAGTMESALNPGPPSTRKCNHCAFEFVCAEDGERWCPACQSFDTRQIGHEIGTGSETKFSTHPVSGNAGAKSMPAEMVRYDPAPECKGEIAARERLEPEGSGGAAGNADRHTESAQNGVTGRRDGHSNSVLAVGILFAPHCPRCERDYVQDSTGAARWSHPFSERGCRYSGMAVVVPQRPVGVPEGWKLVPIKPTDAMIYAMTRATENHAERVDSYHEMLSAAPNPVHSQGNADWEGYAKRLSVALDRLLDSLDRTALPDNLRDRAAKALLSGPKTVLAQVRLPEEPRA